MKKYLLYKREKNYDLIADNIDIKTHKLKNGLFLLFEKHSFKMFILRLYFLIISFGRAKIYYVIIDNELAHFSFVFGKCIKFPFLNNEDICIGPCFTKEKFRGKGIYKSVLCYINKLNTKGNNYIFVSVDNKASISGIEKSGFAKIGYVKRTVFKNFKLIRGR